MIVLQHGCDTTDASCEQEAFGPDYSRANGRCGTLDGRRQEVVLARKQLVVDLRKISKRMGASRLTLDHGIQRHGLLFTTGFKPRIATYDGWEVPVPLSISVQRGEADLAQVARDILGLTKLNYNACQLGESQPITVKYSDRIGEILLANPEVPRECWRHNFKYYI